MFRMIGTLTVLFVALVALIGCDSLPKDLEERAALMPEQIKQAEDEIKNAQARYTQFADGADYEFFRPYAERENWAQVFPRAESEIAVMKEVRAKTVGLIVRADKSEDAARLKAELDSIKKTLGEVQQSVRRPRLRIELVRNTRDHADERIAEVNAKYNLTEIIFTDLANYVGNVKEDYPDRKGDIHTRFSPVVALFREAQAMTNSARGEYARYTQGGSADYLVFGDAHARLLEREGELQSQDKKIRSMMAELYISYTKILTDMKAEYWVTVGRTSWDESSDWSTEVDHIYPAQQVTAEAFDIWDDLPDHSEFGTYSTGLFGGISIETRYKAVWEELRLDPKAEWHGWSHGNASLWVADTVARYYHKYTLIKGGGEQEETGWIEVDEDDFEEYFDDLGMEIEAKALGQFEDEATKSSSPPGMSFVGNSRYGQWQTGSDGGHFWAWYGQYRLLSDFLGGGRPYYYSRAEYDDWHRNYRNRETYYGASTTSGSYRFGTHSDATRTSGRFQSSTFARTGGFREASASVRGAGAGMRGGGPGGGGK